MLYTALASFADDIQAAQNFGEKIVVFWNEYKVWILVGLVVLVGIIVFVNLLEAKRRRDARRNGKNK